MKTILVVDDEHALVESLTELLQDEGYRVVSAANGEDALERLKSEKPDLVLTDLMMPIANGWDFVRGARALADFRRTPIVMMSATTKAVAISDEHGQLDISAYAQKPVAWEKLRDLILKFIGPGENVR